jgi:hypothetical protein
MTKQIFKLLMLVAFISCQSNSTKEKEASDIEIADTVFESSNDTGGDSSLFVKNKSLLWQVDDTKGLKLQKPGVRGIDTMSAKNLILLINNN